MLTSHWDCQRLIYWHILFHDAVCLLLFKVQTGRHTNIPFSLATFCHLCRKNRYFFSVYFTSMFKHDDVWYNVKKKHSCSQPRSGNSMNPSFKTVFTWFGSGSTSFQFSVKSPQPTGVKGLCLTEGRMRYNQLEKRKRDWCEVRPARV